MLSVCLSVCLCHLTAQPLQAADTRLTLYVVNLTREFNELVSGEVFE